MKQISLIAMISCSLMTAATSAQTNSTESAKTDSFQSAFLDFNTSKSQQQRVNFYVVNKPKSLDIFSRFVILRARKQAMTRRHKFIVIVATSSKEAGYKIQDYLVKKNAKIGTLWFDTHGRYANGYSSFILGKD